MSLLSFSASRFTAALLVSSALVMVGACSSGPDKGEPPIVSVHDYLKSAYLPPDHFKLFGYTGRWALGADTLNISLLVPSGQPHVPLIIYLPGLGESVADGELWRQTWAEAGYAVLAIQAPTDDHDIYDSADAQDGAFRSIAAKHYADQSLQTRVSQVNKALAEAQRRGLAGEAGFSQLDTQRIVVAGFDLGAQTAAALAGERGVGEPRAVGWRPLAAILLSPYVPDGVDRARYGQIDTPLLAITGFHDEDPFSWVASHEQRLYLYAGLTGSAYQLSLASLSHDGLSGTLPGAEKDKVGQPDAEESDASGSKHHRGHKAGAGDQHADDAPFDPRQAAAIVAVSNAFLDSTLKQSPAAHQWLNEQAPQWLEKSARLERKGPATP